LRAPSAAAALLLAADILVRVVMLGPELKARRSSHALVGAPFFLWLIFRARTELES
jgi:iron complex transport system permease protein